jgi:hypothetical protein
MSLIFCSVIFYSSFHFTLAFSAFLVPPLLLLFHLILSPPLIPPLSASTSPLSLLLLHLLSCPAHFLFSPTPPPHISTSYHTSDMAYADLEGQSVYGGHRQNRRRSNVLEAITYVTPHGLFSHVLSYLTHALSSAVSYELYLQCSKECNGSRQGLQHASLRFSITYLRSPFFYTTSATNAP